jgi:hypothetical protein
MLSGISCLFANTRSGTPFKQLLDIILSVNNTILICHRKLPKEHSFMGTTIHSLLFNFMCAFVI